MRTLPGDPPAYLDSRYDWIRVQTFGRQPQWIRGQCRHLESEVVPVESAGQVVAHLCTTCDLQISVPGWS